MLIIKLTIAILFIVFCMSVFDLDSVIKKAFLLLHHPLSILLMAAVYLLTFYLKAKAWQLYLADTGSVKPYLDAALYGLFINHLLPFKGGELVRIGYIHHVKNLSWQAAAESTVWMRIIDVAVLASIAASGAVLIGFKLSFGFLAVIAGIGAIMVMGILLHAQTRRFILTYLSKAGKILLSRNGAVLITLIAASWALEAVVIYTILLTLGEPSLHFFTAVWVNSFTIAGQIFQFAPGGIGTYESFMSLALTAVGYPASIALTVAVLTHAFKFVFSFICGIYLILFAPIRVNELKIWLKSEKRA